MVAACGQEDDQVLPGHDGVALRVQNQSNFTIESLEVEPGAGGYQVYENIAPGATSAYQPFDFIYSYAYLRAVIAGDTLTLQPIDYVGAEPYNSGAYTYLLQVNGESEPTSLSIEFRED
jgi:hypothetical protein